MAEYIDREEIMLKTCANCTRQIGLVCQHPEPCERLIAAFLEADAVDVEPVVHAEWEEKTDFFGDSAWVCSASREDDGA